MSNDIEKIIEGLELIEIVIPSYKYARRKGLIDDEAETVVNWALEQAIILLEQLIGQGLYIPRKTRQKGAEEI